MIRLGIVGCNYGRAVQLPAFRTDGRCEVIALAGSDTARTARIAQESGIANAFGNWADLVEDSKVDAVAVATPPALQPQIATRALSLGKPVFVGEAVGNQRGRSCGHAAVGARSEATEHD